jgi:hypothetical protein
LASQTSAIFFQTRWDCLGSKAAIYIAPTGLRKQEEKESKWRREREREREREIIREKDKTKVRLRKGLQIP